MKRIGALALCFGVTTVSLCGCAKLENSPSVETSIVYVYDSSSSSVASEESQKSLESTALSSDGQENTKTTEDSTSTTNEYYDSEKSKIYKIDVSKEDFCAAAIKAIGDKKENLSGQSGSKIIAYDDREVLFIYGKYADKQRDGSSGAEAAMDEFEKCYFNFRSNIFRFVGSSMQYKNEPESFGYLIMNGTIKSGSHLRFFQFDKKDDTSEDLECYVFLFVYGNTFIEARTLDANEENIRKIDVFLNELGLPTCPKEVG